MKVFILIIWLVFDGTGGVGRGGITSVVFQSEASCSSALTIAKAKDFAIRGVCVPQGRE